jgi:hypothetical protein
MSPELVRNKILKVDNATVSIYLNKVDVFRLFNFFLKLLLKNITLTASITDGNTTIATASKQLDKPLFKRLLMSQRSRNPLLFTFSGEDYELVHGHQLGLSLVLNKKPIIQRVKLQYDQVNYPSSLRVKFEDTKNLLLHDVTENPPDGKVIPGGTIKYTLNVTSLYADSIRVRTIQKEKTGTWDVVIPSTTTVSAHSWVQIPVSLKSTNSLKEAYGNTITLVVVVEGDTGIARSSISAEVSADAIQYKVEILGYSDAINMSKGENKTFYFIIKNNNTGAVDDTDSYTITASSEHNWPLTPRTSIKDLKRGASTEPTAARVFISAPKNTTASSDVITITVTSDSNSAASATITVTVHVIGGGALEEIYNFFDATAKSLGLTDIFGSDGAFVLAIILVVIILFILIILALVLTMKPARLICTDRIKEIESTEKAVYELTIQNPLKKQQTYEIYAKQTAPTDKWIVSIQPLSISIDGRSTQPVQITATPTDHANPGDWTQITTQVKRTGKKKSARIALMTMLKEGKTLLQLENVSHWPSEFNPTERVTTSFSIANNGTITARDVAVFFYLNGKQKNKLNVSIPAGAVADIQIPWIAAKGKNQVRIRLKEQ